MMQWLRESGTLDWIIRIVPIVIFMAVIAWASVTEENENEHDER